MRRLLFVSKHYSSDFGARVGGVYQRMRVLLEAASRSARAIDILFFVDQDVIDRVGPMPAQETLARNWGIEATVLLAPRAQHTGSRLAKFIGPAFDFRRNESFFRYIGSQQRDAIRGALKSDTDLVIAHRIFIAAAVIEAMPDDGMIPIISDIDDIEHRMQARSWFQSPLKVASMLRVLEYPAVKRGELATINSCRDAFVCSTLDQSYLRALGARHVTVIPNTVRFPAEVRIDSPAPKKTLFFIGTYSYAPNRVAAEHLMLNIFPLVRRKIPEARLIIAGEAVEQLPSFGQPLPNVDFAGFLPDLGSAYRAASVVCCPILVGGGTRIKIIEAAAHGRAVVSTHAGAEGLEFVDGKEILLRDSVEAFAEACVGLLEDQELADRLGIAAHAKARLLYERGTVVDRVASIYERNALSPQS